jgi:hypothetical protein
LQLELTGNVHGTPIYLGMTSFCEQDVNQLCLQYKTDLFGPFANVKKYIVGHGNGNMQKTWTDKIN